MNKSTKKISSIIRTVLSSSFLMAAYAQSAQAAEIVIGPEQGSRIEPGIVLIFEAAQRDRLKPAAQNLSNNKSDIHLEARANWDTSNLPPGTPAEGFVPYMNIHAEVTNETQSNGDRVHVTLVPMINLIDNFHYARNIQLPGDCNDIYTVKFFVNPPDKFSLATHQDWRDLVGNKLFNNAQTFTFTGNDFSSNCQVDR